MKKIIFKFSSLVLAALVMCAGLCGCFGEGEPPQKLDTPQVVIDGNGVAVWNAVDGAIYYAYVIGDGAEIPTTDCSVQLSENDTLKVKAVSGREGYADSDFSAPQTYHKEEIGAHDHTDVNADGACDRCGESVVAELSFYAVNDLHGKFMDSSTQPGVDEFTTYMKSLYADPIREEILLSSGDMWQGTAESLLNRGKLMTEWMNEVGFVSMTLGNHEFDWGSDVLTPNSELAEFPFLAINVRENGVMPAYCKASVVERGDVKVGIIGAIGDCLSSVSSEFRGGLRFETGSNLTNLVKNEATRLRTEENCDFIVYSIHDGSEDTAPSVTSVTDSDMGWYDSSLSNGFIDLVFEGHTHKQYTLQDEYGVYHMQGSSENRDVSCAELSFNTITGDFTVTPRHIGTGVYANSSLEDDPVVDELYGKYFPERDLYTPIGYTRSTRNSNTILNKVAELYYLKGCETWSEYEIVCGGGYLNARNPYNLYAGDVSYADIATVLPFDNEIVLGSIRGSDLIKFLNKRTSSGVKYTIYTTIETSQVSAGETYYIIVDSYTSTYRTNNITEVKRLGSGIYARDLLADYIRAGNWAK